MKIIFLLAFFAACKTICFAQKPPLNYTALANWPKILSENISNDGKYVSYIVSSNNKPGSPLKLFIQSNDKSFKKEIQGVSDAIFSEDSRKIIFKNTGDSLYILDLGINREYYVPNVRSFKMPQQGNGKWMACLLATKELLLFDLFSMNKRNYPYVNDYIFGNTGEVLLIKGNSSKDSCKTNVLQWINLSNGQAIRIWHGVNAMDFAFDRSETKLAFIARTKEHLQIENAIWYYQEGMDSAHIWINDQSPGLDSAFAVCDDGLLFSPDGNRLFFDIRCASKPKIDSEASSVDIWNYQDEFIQSDQLADLKYSDTRSFKAVVYFNNDRVIRLEQENDGSWGEGRLNNGNNDDYWLTEGKTNYAEGYRLVSERPDIYLVSTIDGTRKCIKKHSLSFGPARFSPDGRYVYWYEMEKRGYFVYDIQTGITQNISAQLHVPTYDEVEDYAGYPRRPYGQAIWLENDEAILIYDRYDIWRVDPARVTPPINITNGFGRRNKIVLRFIVGQNPFASLAVKRDSTVFLSAFNERTKYNGFFKKAMNSSGDPIQLSMLPAFFYYPKSSLAFFISYNILKAKNTNVFLLKRMSASEFPNLYSTKDFMQFNPLSDLAPQKAFNWLTSELVGWKTFDGHPGQGILYKPEDFDSRRKYPIIFYFYELLSDGLNNFIDPDLSDGPMNIPWFVSHGYLVFCPDIHYTVGAPGESVYNYVVSAAKMMSKKPWVDTKRMGIQGHSWGGYEVNYLVTRTGLFAAAASAAGPSDWVSDYGSLTFGGKDTHSYLEQAQPRLGMTLWQNPMIYIKNSPLFAADKVTTPLLIMHNKLDGAVPWAQGVEFFTALRRLGKRAWMLQYDNGSHVLRDDKDCLDYSIRLNQFFDHYLMGKPSPEWMSFGIPAKLKLVDNGLQPATVKMEK